MEYSVRNVNTFRENVHYVRLLTHISETKRCVNKSSWSVLLATATTSRTYIWTVKREKRISFNHQSDIFPIHKRGNRWSVCMFWTFSHHFLHTDFALNLLDCISKHFSHVFIKYILICPFFALQQHRQPPRACQCVCVRGEWKCVWILV